MQPSEAPTLPHFDERTLLADPAVREAVLAAGFTVGNVDRWLRIAYRRDIKFLFDYLDMPDEELLHLSNFGVRCLGITHTLRLML